MPDVILVNPLGFKVIGDRTMPMGLLSISSYASKDFNIKEKIVSGYWAKKLSPK